MASICSFDEKVIKTRGHNVLQDLHHYEEPHKQGDSGNMQELRVFSS